MKPKQLIPLAVIVVILAGLVILRQADRKPPSLNEQYTLAPLLPEDIDFEKVDRLELYAGAAPDEKLVLTRSDADGWVVTSHFDAPVLDDKIEKFLDTLGDLAGEFRATVEAGALSDYNLGEGDGFHVVGYAMDGDEPLFHVINGKSPDIGEAFARADGRNEVYLIDVSLRREAGIYTVEIDDAPEPGPWLNKNVLDLESTSVKAVSLTYPDKQVAFALEKKEPAEETSGEESDDSEDSEPVETVVEFEWVVTSGGGGEEFNTNAVVNLTRRVAGLNASDLVDPSKLAEWGLDAPRYRIALTLEGEDAPLVIEANRQGDDRYAYFRVVTGGRERVYKINGYDFEQIFQKGGEFFELPGVLVDQKEVDSIAYTTDGHTVTIARDGENWNITQPETDIAVNERAVDSLVRTLLSWKAEDYADSDEGKGLDDAPDRATFTGPNVTHTILLGAQTPAGGRYARLDGRPQVLTMSESDVAAVLVPYGSLFETGLFDVVSSDIATLTITKDGATTTLTRTGEGWTVTVGDDSAPGDDLTITNVLNELVSLEAEDFDFGDAQAEGNVLAFTTEDGSEHRVTIGPDQDGYRPVVRQGSTTAYLVPAEDIALVLVEADTLKSQPAPDVSDVPVDEAASPDVP